MAEFITDRAGIQAFRETDDYKKILAEAYKWHKKHGTMKGFDGGADLGIKFRPKNVVNYDKQTGLGSDPIASRKAEGKARLDKIKKQTVGKKNLPKTDTAAIEVHHLRMVDLYDNLYEGLDDADSAKLSQFFSEDLNMPLGDKYANAAFLPKKPHDKVHKFIDNEVLEGLPDFNSPKYKKVELPDGTILEGLEARKFHAKNFFGDLVQPAIDDATMGFMQDFAQKNPKGYRHLFRDAVNSKAVKGFTKATSAASTAEALLLLGSGQVVPGSIALAMQTPVVQKQVAKKLVKPVGKLLAKQGLKMIPGVSIGSGVLQSIGYLSTGQYGKAALSVGGGVIGEFGPAGDAVQAMIDLGLTAHDIKNPVKTKTTDVDSPNRGVLKTVKKTTKALTK